MPAPLPDRVSVDLIQAPGEQPAQTPTSGRRPQLRRPRAQVRSRQTATGIQDLSPHLSFSPSSSVADSVSAPSGSGEWRIEDWGVGGGQVRHLDSTAVLMRLAEELDGAMSFPHALGRRQFEGTILARLHFRPEGGCDWSRTKILPGEPHFRVYVLALLKKVCGLGQVAQMKFPTADFVDLSFRFKLIAPGETVDPDAGKFMTGNVLAFERNYVRSPLKIEAGPFKFFDGSLVGINFEWLFDTWDKVVGDYRDPMKEFDAN